MASLDGDEDCGDREDENATAPPAGDAHTDEAAWEPPNMPTSAETIPVAAKRNSPRSSKAAGGGDNAETMSTTSDLECPVCYQAFCEPVFAGCGRHAFCRHCLWQTQRDGMEQLRCPMCRAVGPRDIRDLAEVDGLGAKLRKKDPVAYDERAARGSAEREKHRLARHAAWEARQAETPIYIKVNGAGVEEVNGEYIAEVLPAYMGPTVYRKQNTAFYIYRWHRTHWVLAELNRSSRMGSERSWLYMAPTQSPPDVPPAGGWVTSGHSMTCLPAPEMQVLSRATSASRSAPAVAETNSGSSGGSSLGPPPSPVPSRTTAFSLGLPVVRLPTILNNQSSAADQRRVPSSTSSAESERPERPDNQHAIDIEPTSVGCNRCSPPCAVM